MSCTANLTPAADLEATCAYLRTIPALTNRVPEPWAPAAPATAAAK